MVISMKREIILILHAIINRLHNIKLTIERFYIRTSYNNVVNDLHINPSEKYEAVGVYVTLNRKHPRNYKRHIDSFNCDENGIRRFLLVNGNKEKCLVYNSIHIAHQGLTEYGYYLHDKKMNECKL